MIKRLVAQELTLSFVPEPEQRLWRTVTRRKQQLTRDKVRLTNQLESLLEQAHIKCRALCRICWASVRGACCKPLDGATDPAGIAALADSRLRATPEQLQDALGACQQLHAVYRRLLKMTLASLKLIEDQIEQLEREAARTDAGSSGRGAAVGRNPRLRTDSAHQMIAEIGATAAAFDSAKALSSWVGVCPGDEESAGESKSTRSPKGTGICAAC